LAEGENQGESMSVLNMKSNPPRPNEEPYVGKLLVRFREGPGRQLPGLLDNSIVPVNLNQKFSFINEHWRPKMVAELNGQ
jgi:hypothetical protein